MKNLYLILVAALIIFTGCDDVAKELKTQLDTLRIENASLKAQVTDLDRQLRNCKEDAVQKLYKYDPAVTNPNDNQGY
jgi:chaperonin cofactor prefoldin